MKKENKRFKRERLNELGKCWTPTQENWEVGSAEKKKLWFEITQIAFELFEPINYGQSDFERDCAHDALQDILFKEVYKKFDPTKCSLNSYISTRYPNRVIDMKRKIGGRIYEDEEKNRRQSSIDDLHAEGAEIQDFRDDFRKIEDYINLPEMLRLMALIFSLKKNEKYMTNTTVHYFRLFYTSAIISIEKDGHLPVFKHEREIAAELLLPFVDFCMEEKWNEDIEKSLLRKIYKGDLKLYGKVVDDTGKFSPEDSIPIPIPDKVGISYLKRKENKSITKGGYSQQKAKYEVLIKEIVEKGMLS